MKGMFKSKKLIAGLVTAALATGAMGTAVNAQTSFFSSLFGGNKDAAAEGEEGPNLATVEVRDIENTVNLTGALAAASEVTAAANKKVEDLPISEVKVKVGDMVKAGDVLYTLDTRSIEKTIRETEQQLANLERENQIDAAQEKRAKDKTEKDNATSRTMEVRDIYNSEDHLDDNFVDRGLDLDELHQNYGIEDGSYYEAVNAQLAMFDAEDDLNAAYDDPGATDEELDELTEVYNEAVKTFNSALDAYETAIKTSMSSEKTVRSDNRTIRDAEKGLLDKWDSLEKADRERKESEIQAAEKIEKGNLERSVSDQKLTTELETAREKLDVATVTTPISGVVTAVNAKAGQAAGTDAVTVTGIDSYNVSCDIDEKYIADIKKDMKVRFTTDATGDEPLNGIVTFTAVTPTKQKNDSSSGSDGQSQTSTSGSTDKSRGSYRVLIKVLDKNERLRPGMSTKIIIITAESNDVLSVPNEALQTNNDGDSYLLVTTDDGATTQEVIVEAGLTDGTYTEVSGSGISEGTQIVIPEAENFALDFTNLY
ncbi:MAG: biotin/lipoyl-binding protein [Lachnospiraceae bacterium]|nr:biotin/lipoyl-binding protein [Lachnospiraceae bacterium]